jgi:hypothetical protein
MSVSDDPPPGRAERMLGLIRELRSLTVQVAKDASGKEPRMYFDQGKLHDEWEKKILELLREHYRAVRETPCRVDADFSTIAGEFVAALDAHAESKLARDRLGDRRIDQARQHLVSRLIGFAQAILQARRR